jgi:hypothetical protein
MKWALAHAPKLEHISHVVSTRSKKFWGFHKFVMSNVTKTKLGVTYNATNLLCKM